MGTGWQRSWVWCHASTAVAAKPLGAISKRGDPYLRTLLIHGARSVLRHAARKTDVRSRWLQGLMARRHRNVAAVALANKNARIAWALLARGQSYRPAVCSQ